MSDPTVTQLSIAPLGAGDLIDRAVRLYRRHLFILIRIAAPPVIIAAAGWILLSFSFKQITTASETSDVFLYIFLIFLGLAITLGGHLFTLVVMGGSTRNLVAHLLFNDPVSARATYRAVRDRFWGLVGASLIVLFWIGISWTAAFTVWYTIAIVILAGSMLLVYALPTWVSVILGSIGGVASAVVLLWLFFFVAGRVAYFKQTKLLE